jgi:multidrug efflux system membrane fusion protein
MTDSHLKRLSSTESERRGSDTPQDEIVAPAWTETRPPAAASRLAPQTQSRSTVGRAPEPEEAPHEPRRRDVDQSESPRPTKAKRGWLWPVLIVLVLLGGGYYWYRGHAAEQQKQAQAAAKPVDKGVPVKVAEAKTADLPLYLSSLGNVQAFNTVTIRSRVDGEVIKIAFEEGQIVQQGDLLAQIDPRPFQAALDGALAKKQQDEATQANNRRDLQRTTELGDYATRQQRDTQTAGISSLTAQIAADQAAIENAQTQLSYTTIRAPLTGRTGLRLVDQGNIVHATDATGIVEIAQIQPISVLFTAPQQQLPAIAEAMKRGKVPVSALNSDGQTTLGEGELSLINNAIDAASGTVRLKATFANADERLWPGLSVNTRLLVKTMTGVVAVPSDAIQRGPNGLFCYVVGDGDKVQKRDIEVGAYTEGQAIVEKGVRASERVVIAGQYRLIDGSKVQIGADPADKTAPKPEHVSAN